MENTQTNAQTNVQENGQQVQQTPKTYSEEDYNKLLAEMTKFKTANDKLSKENADYKRQAKDKLSEEEKQAQEQQEKEEKYAQILKDNRQLKMTSKLSQGGYSQEETDKIVELLIEGDDTKIVDYLCNFRKDLTENLKKNFQKEFSQQNHVPGGGSGNSNVESEASKRAKGFNSPLKELKTWGNFSNN